MAASGTRWRRPAVSLLAVAVIAALLLALWRAGQAPADHETRLQHFGTSIRIVLSDISPADASRHTDRLDARLADWHRRWHAWQPSELTALNEALGQGQGVAVAADLAGLLRRSQTYAEQTEGLFNPALGRRLADWGFQQADPTAARAAPAALDPERLPRMSDLVWADDGRLHSRHQEMQLDLGGIAKGYALDALLADLRQHGVSNALVDLGGDIGVLGQHRSRPWQVGVLADTDRVIASVTLADGELAFSSGTYQPRHPTGDGGSAHHVLDPRTGAPATGNQAVTVLGRDGELLQVASKVLLIAGSDWPRYAKRLGIPLALVVRPDGSVELTAALAARLTAGASERQHWRVLPSP